MNENKYKKRFDFQQKMISRQSEQIEELKLKIESLELKLKEKDQIIYSITPLRNELTENVNEVKRHKKEYQNLISEVKEMKEIVNKEVYKGRWRLVKFLIN